MSTTHNNAVASLTSKAITTNLAISMLRNIKLVQLHKFIDMRGKTEYKVGDELTIELSIINGNYSIEDIEVEDTIPIFFQLQDIKIQSSARKIPIRIEKSRFRILIKIEKLLPKEQVRIKYTIIPLFPGKHLIPSAACYSNGIVIGASEPLTIHVSRKEDIS